MKTTIGELRALIREKVSEPSSQPRVFDVDVKDVRSAIEVSKQRYYLPEQVGGKGVYCPYTCTKTFNTNVTEKDWAAMGAEPFDIITAAKQGTYQSKKSGNVFKAEPEVLEFMANYMADGIYRGLASNSYDAVLNVESSSRLSSMIAARVAERMGVKILSGHITKDTGGLQKTVDPSTIKIDQEKLDQYTKINGEEKGDNLLKILTRVIKTIKNKISRGEKISVTDDIKDRNRKYILGLHQFNASKNLTQPLKKVLVIDDNVASSATMRDVKKTLASQGIDADLACGVFIGSKNS